MGTNSEARAGHVSGGEVETGAARVKRELAETLKEGVTTDVVAGVQAKIVEDAGAVALKALEPVPCDIPAQREPAEAENGTLPGSRGEHQLQERFQNVARAYSFYNNQVLDHLNPLMQEYIARQPMFFIGTADARGNCDCSLRVGDEGVMRVIDKTTLLYPEYRGNGVMASLGNIIENPHIGIFFGDFYRSTVGLHVNGSACLLSTDEVSASLAARGDLLKSLAAEFTRRLDTWVRITVEEAYMHCSKHIPLLKPLDKKLHWGTDDLKFKRGDYFHVRSQRTQAIAQPRAT
jgi:uncharacterized protein